MVSNTFLQRRALKRDDLVTLTRQIGGDYAITGNRDLGGEPLHRGHISVVSFGELSVHTVDVVDLEDFAAEASMPASLSFSFVLNGSVTMTIGGKDLHIGRDAAATRPEGGYLLLYRVISSGGHSAINGCAPRSSRPRRHGSRDAMKEEWRRRRFIPAFRGRAVCTGSGRSPRVRPCSPNS